MKFIQIYPTERKIIESLYKDKQSDFKVNLF
jgi:hypothetical protein